MFFYNTTVLFLSKMMACYGCARYFIGLLISEKYKKIEDRGLRHANI